MVSAFLKKTEQATHRSLRSVLHSHFFNGTGAVDEFLEEVAGQKLRGLNLEVISPYFDQALRCKPLRDLIERFHPVKFSSTCREVRPAKRS